MIIDSNTTNADTTCTGTGTGTDTDTDTEHRSTGTDDAGRAASDRSLSERRLRLASGLGAVQRDASTVQIGFDEPRRIMVRDAPRGTVELLTAMAGHRTTADLTRGFAADFGVSPQSWDGVLEQLYGAGFLTATSAASDSMADTPDAWSKTPAGCVPDLAALSASLGPDRAGAAMSRRRDAVVVVVGVGRVACSIATLLAAAGVGHVHLHPHRALRPTDAAPAGLAADQVDRGARESGPLSHHRSTAHREDRALRDDREALAAVIRRVAPTTIVHPPGGYVPPSLVVLATDAQSDEVQARALVGDRVPHLAVRAGEARGVIGPLVLPGRSSCLHCHDLARCALDPGFARVRLARRHTVPVPPTVLATSVAAIAAGQALEFLDTRLPPITVDGTLELGLDVWRVRRRSWQRHRDCFCRSS